ncbi:MAG: hypothetical protein V2A76_08030 [Planctomycetota bacterium]
MREAVGLVGVAAVILFGALLLKKTSAPASVSQESNAVHLTDESPPVEEAGQRQPVLLETAAVPCTGSIEIVFLNESDEPVDGVAVLLTLGGQRPDPSRMLTSDAQGFVAWEELEPNIYRWVLLGEHRFWPGGEPNGHFPLRRSEPIEIAAGATSRFTITLFGGVVTGRIHLPGALGKRAAIKVFDVIEREQRQESLVRTDDGGFRFSTISSGKKILSAVAEVEGQHFYFYRRRFSIEPSGNVDLGTLYPLEGPISDGLIVLEHAGVSLETQAVYGTSPLDALLQVVNREVTPGDSFVQQTFDVTVGEPFFLHGITPGEWLLNVTSGYHQGDFWPNPLPGYRVDTDHHRVVEAPFTGVRLPFSVQSSVPVTIRVRFPDAVDPFRTTVVLHSPRRAAEEIRIRRPRDGNEAVRRLELPVGTYRVLAHPEPRFATEASFWYCETRADVHGQETEILIAFTEGTCIRGQVRDPNGNPVSRRVLGAGFPEWTDQGGSPVYCYKVVADDSGQFMLPGIPPSREVLFSGGQSVQSGAAGAVTEVTLSFAASVKQSHLGDSHKEKR